MENSQNLQNSLNSILADITKSSALSEGKLEEVAHFIAKSSCYALNTHRIGIWRTNEEAKNLTSVTYFDVSYGLHSIQENFNLENRKEYVNALKSERLIVIPDVKKPNVLADVVDDYGPNIIAMLDAPIFYQGKLAGVVCIEQDKSKKYPNNRYWTIEEQNFASSLADFIALAMSNNDRIRLMHRTETMMSNLPGMVYQCLNDPPFFTFTFVSEGCYSLTGYTPEELVGNSALKFLDMVHPDDANPLEKLNEVTLSVGLPLETTFRIIMKDGEEKWIWERSRAVEMNVDGTPHLLEGFYTDITHQRRMEAAELANKAKSRFLAKMSHEIRTPMNAIIGMAQLVLREEISSKAREHTISIHQAGKNLLSIINDILDFSKIESGHLELVQNEYLLSSLIYDIISIVNVQTRDANLDFIVNIQNNLPNSLLGDSDRLRQIILNLLANAVKYTDIGFVSLIIEGEVRDKKVYLVIKVSDSGRGIKKEDIKDLFQEFTQVDTLANKGIEGTGLGLAITHNLVTSFGGNIEVESIYESGSTFTINLSQDIIKNEPIAVIEESDKKQTLCFIEQEVIINTVLWQLEYLGIKCRVVTSIKELYKYLKSNMYDFAFIETKLYENFIKTYNNIESITQFILIEDSIDNANINTYNMPTLTTPIYCVPIASVLNYAFDKNINKPHNSSNNNIAFIAPTAKVLIVDDINTNLVVAEGLLSPYKMQVDTVESGKKAIELVSKHRYDIVFMDHMMPGLDGVETTQIIRNMTEETAKGICIVALTANAVSGTKDMFLKNGFNSFLSKPIEIDKLNQTVEKYIPIEKRQPYENEVVESASIKKIEIEGVDTVKGLVITGGNIESYIRILKVFCEDGYKKIKDIQQSLKTKDIRLYTICVHSLKSVSESIGSVDLSRKASDLEKAAKKNDLEFITTNTPAFINNLKSILENIKKSVYEQEEGYIDFNILENTLKLLKAAIEDYNILAINSLSKSLEGYQNNEVIGDYISIIISYKIRGDYDEAIDVIKKLLDDIKHTH